MKLGNRNCLVLAIGLKTLQNLTGYDLDMFFNCYIYGC